MHKEAMRQTKNAIFVQEKKINKYNKIHEPRVGTKKKKSSLKKTRLEMQRKIEMLGKSRFNECLKEKRERKKNVVSHQGVV